MLARLASALGWLADTFLPADLFDVELEDVDE